MLQGKSKSCGCLGRGKSRVEEVDLGEDAPSKRAGRPLKLKDVDFSGLTRQFYAWQAKEYLIAQGHGDYVKEMEALKVEE